MLELLKFKSVKQDELIMKDKKLIFILKQYDKSMKKNKPSLTFKNLFDLENNERLHIQYTITNLDNRINEIIKKHNLETYLN
jgi:hypothetical protein